MQNFNTFLKESSLSRLWSKYKNFESGTISACRAGMTNTEKNSETLKLKTELIKRGYSVTAINGVFFENFGMPNEVEVHEKSFIVFAKSEFSNLKDDLMKLGEFFNQDSITYSEKNGNYFLIGTNHTGFPGYHKVIKLGTPMFGKKGDFYSSVKGRPFVFESVEKGFLNFDCSQKSYSKSINFGMKYYNFVLSE